MLSFSGEKLRAKREAKGLTQMELGLQCGVYPVTVSNWETGRTAEPGAGVLQRFAEIFGCDTGDFFEERPNASVGE